MGAFDRFGRKTPPAQEAGGVRHLGRLGWQSSDRHTVDAAGYAAGPRPPGGAPWRHQVMQLKS